VTHYIGSRWLRSAISTAFLGAAAATGWHALRDPQISPRSSAPFIDRGLTSERAGDFAAAERSLLEAARLDRQYLPAWTLANFYFRQHAPEQFWTWAHRAAALVYDDPSPLLQLGDVLDPGHALDHLADSPKLERAYLDLLIRDDRLVDAMVVARKMLLSRDRDNASRLRAFTTRLIVANRFADALEVWNSLGEPYGSLLHLPAGEGFDWRLPASQGVFSAWHSPPPSFVLDFTLDGHQPEAIPLLERVVPYSSAVDSQPRRLTFEYSTDLPGLHWALDSAISPVLPPSPWHDATWLLPPSTKPLVKLVLFYRRDPGTPRAVGRLQIRNIRFVVK
jgi:hypothetical protein